MRKTIKVPRILKMNWIHELSISVVFNNGESRLSLGLTQQELAVMSGTTRNYISRIENDRSDIELGTLRKIIETGLGKQLSIVIK